jgi:epoxyqueuosine reductase
LPERRNARQTETNPALPVSMTMSIALDEAAAGCDDGSERDDAKDPRRPDGGRNVASVKRQLRDLAHLAGFDLCGFARVEPPPHGEFLRRWLAEGRAATMGYIGNGLAKRLDPQLVLPGARSVVTVGVRYQAPPLPPVDWRKELRGRIAAYALGADYHRTVKRRLKDLATRIAARFPRAELRPYVDTGPVLEREWAAAGGLGWFGKNTNILHREQGSWFFLGELLTTLDIEPDMPMADHCGTCVRCLDLCPTGALEPGYVLDARKCISYWTIEHRGAIPRDMRAQIDNWVFGCDVCQEVCPWNEKLARSIEAPAVDALLPSLPELMGLGEEGFRARFRGTAVLRAKREGLLRNTAVVLGNTRNPRAAAALGDALADDPSAVVRSHAAWALGRIGGAAARAYLESARRTEPDTTVRVEIDAALCDAADTR